jgi:geranylgeranyl diphosphate synthase type II
MVSVSTQIGGLVGHAGPEELAALKSYGELVGRAFQVQDDLLDIIGDERTFGKTIGGDLREGKKTFLLLEALRRTKGKEKKALLDLVRNGGIPAAKIARIKKIFESSGAIDAARQSIHTDIDEARKHLRRLNRSEAVSMLEWLSEMLLNRTF